MCPAPEGIIVAGVKQITEVLPSDAWTALATVIMAIFTGILSLVAYQQIGLARNEFLATHRPLLRVRYFKRIDPSDRVIHVTFTVVNVGKTTAHLLGSSVQLAYFGDMLPIPVYATGRDVTGQRKFEPGASDEFPIEAPKNVTHQWLYVYGYIVYADNAGNTRTTAFCRKWIATRSRFIAVSDPDYEYED